MQFAFVQKENIDIFSQIARLTPGPQHKGLTMAKRDLSSEETRQGALELGEINLRKIHGILTNGSSPTSVKKEEGISGHLPDRRATPRAPIREVLNIEVKPRARKEIEYTFTGYTSRDN